jgi:prophage antirepressor-like protein
MDIIKTFQMEGLEKDILIKGTHKNPMFKANDVADLLDIKHIRSVINEFDETEKVSISIKTAGGEQMVNFLTESGLYSLIFRSKKPVAKQFKKWVCEVIKQIRLNGVYQLEQQLKEKEEENNQLKMQNQNLLDEAQRVTAMDGQKVIYIYDTDARVPLSNNKRTLKIGITEHLQKRIKPYKQVTPFGRLIFHVEYSCDNLRTAEQWLHELLKPFRQIGEVFEIELDIAKKWLTLVSNVTTISNNLDRTELERQLSQMVDCSNRVLKKNVGTAAYAEACTQTEEQMLAIDEQPQVQGEDPVISRFEEFINQCCVLGSLKEVSSTDVIGKYRLWSRAVDKETYHKLNDYLHTHFRHIRLNVPNKNQVVNGFRGLTLKEDDKFTLSFSPTDYELFLAHACVFTPSAKVLMTEVLKEYEEWGASVGKVVNAKELKDFLHTSQRVLVANVWTNSGNGQGYYGITLRKYENHHRKASSTAKQVSKRNSTGDVIATWRTIAKAAQDEGMPAAKMSRAIKSGTPINDFIFTIA